MKHVSATTNDHIQLQSNSTPDGDGESASTTIQSTPTSKGKQTFHDRAIQIFEKMAETSTGLMKNFEKTNELLERVDHQFDRLINKL
jgi:PAB1-binding protein PBP1